MALGWFVVWHQPNPQSKQQMAAFPGLSGFSTRSSFLLLFRRPLRLVVVKILSFRLLLACFKKPIRSSFIRFGRRCPTFHAVLFVVRVSIGFVLRFCGGVSVSSFPFPQWAAREGARGLPLPSPDVWSIHAPSSLYFSPTRPPNPSHSPCPLPQYRIMPKSSRTRAHLPHFSSKQNTHGREGPHNKM